MNWPPASDYQDAIQNPSTCFLDLELKVGRPATNKLGLPRVASGNFASVYQVHQSPEKWAVRCFLRQGADQQRRYSLLSQYLSRLTVPGLVEFAYLAQGIKVRGQWYPIVKMDWVEGITLQTYVSRNLHDAAKLCSLTLQWRGLVERLKQCGIAHCDLQHGNVLVTPQEQLRLVDYDGMYVPALKGLPSHELGHPNYQHPGRSAGDYDPNLDNFAALVIYTSLRALVSEPGLWAAFDTGENLLFSASDYKVPAQSPLFQRLRSSPDPGVQTLAARIARACGGSVAQVPDFKRTIDALPEIPRPEPWWHGAVTPPADTHRRPVPNQPNKSAPPKADRATPDKTGRPKDLTPRPPWWKGRGSASFSGLSSPDWLAPRNVMRIFGSGISLPDVGSVLSQALRRAVGCLAAGVLSCVVAVLLSVGLAMALQSLAQQIGNRLWPPPVAVRSAKPTVPIVKPTPPPGKPAGLTDKPSARTDKLFNKPAGSTDNPNLPTVKPAMRTAPHTP